MSADTTNPYTHNYPATATPKTVHAANTNPNDMEERSQLLGHLRRKGFRVTGGGGGEGSSPLGEEVVRPVSGAAGVLGFGVSCEFGEAWFGADASGSVGCEGWEGFYSPGVFAWGAGDGEGVAASYRSG